MDRVAQLAREADRHVAYEKIDDEPNNSRWRGTHYREFYAARTVYEHYAPLPQGFMVALNAFLEREGA